MNSTLKEFISDIFRDLRIEKNYSIDDVAEQTNIDVENLKLLESGYFNFIEEGYIELFITKYATFLGLKSEEFITIFKQHKDIQDASVTRTVSVDELTKTSQMELTMRTQQIRIDRHKKKRKLSLIRYVLILFTVLVLGIGIFYGTTYYLQKKADEKTTLEDCVKSNKELKGC